MMNEKTIIIDNESYVFLAALLGEDFVLGVDDPFFGWLAEQVEEKWKMSSIKMIENGLISIGDDGQYCVSPEVGNVIRVCCSPDFWVSVTTSRQKEEQLSFVLNRNTKDKQAVKVYQNKSKGTIELSYGSYDQKESLGIFNSLGIVDVSENDGVGFDIPESIFIVILKVSVKEGISMLKDISKSNELYAEKFIKALKAPKTKTLINIGSVKANSSDMTSLMLIEGESCLWWVEYDKNVAGHKLCVRQSDSVDCISKLESYLAQYM